MNKYEKGKAFWRDRDREIGDRHEMSFVVEKPACTCDAAQVMKGWKNVPPDSHEDKCLIYKKYMELTTPEQREEGYDPFGLDPTIKYIPIDSKNVEKKYIGPFTLASTLKFYPLIVLPKTVFKKVIKTP